MTCPQCAARAPASARWCGTCGATLRPTDDAVGDTTDDDEDTSEPPDDRLAGRILAAVVVLALLGGLLVAQALEPAVDTPAGYSSRGDGARTGVVSTRTVPAPDGVAWRTDVALPPLTSPGGDVLAVTDAGDSRELVVVTDPAETGQRVAAHDAATGELVATTMLPLGAPPLDTSVSAGLLAHRTIDTVTLVDLATGERRWTIEARLREDTEVTPFGVVGVPAEDAGLSIALLSLEDGSEVWRHQRNVSGRVSRVLATEDAVLLSGEIAVDPFLLALDPVTGEQRWILQGGAVLPPPEFPSAPPVAGAGHVLLPGGRRAVLVDVTAGSVTEVALPEGFIAAVGDIDGDRAILSDGGSRLVGLDLGGPAPVVAWQATLNRPPVLMVDVRGDLAAVRTDGDTTLLDAATGDTLARVAPGGGSTRLALTSDGAVARIDDGMLEAVGPTGPVWRVPTLAVHLPDLATDEGAVAVTTPDGVQVHDVEDGARRWSHEAFEPSLVTAGTLTPPAMLGGRVTISPPLGQPADRGGVLALFADSGIVDWARSDDRVTPRGTPVVDRDLVLLPVGSQVLGFDRRTGRRALVVETSIARGEVAAAGDFLVATDLPRDGGDVWVGRRSTRDIVYRAPLRACAPPLVHDDLVIVTTHLGDIIARDLATGEQPWGERAGGSACRPLAIAGDTLVALVDDRELLGVGLGDGDTSWRVTLPAVAAGAPVVAGEQVLVPTVEAEVLAYEVGRDEPVWRVAVPGVPAGAVAVDGDTVLVVTRDGELVGLR